VPREGLSLASRRAVALLGLGTASHSSLLLGIDSGVQVPIASRAVGSLPSALYAALHLFVPREGLEPSRLIKREEFNKTIGTSRYSHYVLWFVLC